MVPAFSVSASAINIDGYDVFTNVYDPQLGDYKEFENTLSLSVSEKSVRIIFDIHLPEVIEKNTVFDLAVDFNIGQYLSISEWNGGGTMYDSNWNQLDGTLPGIVQNGKLIESQIIASGNVKFIRYVFDIYNPTWHIINSSGFDGVNLSGTTWLFNSTISKPTEGVYLSSPYSQNLHCIIMNRECYPTYKFVSRDLYYSFYVYADNERFRMHDLEGHVIEYSLSTLENKTITFYSGFDPSPLFIPWLQSNATLQSSSNTQAVLYTFDFAVTSVTLTQEKEDTGIFAGIFGWVKKIFNAILDIPNLIGNKLTEFGNWLINQIEGLFIPSEESIIQIKDKFESLLADRFGAAYQAVEIVDQFGQAMGVSNYSDSAETITFPEVTVPLAGSEFTFGGWEVDVVPDGFKNLVDPLKVIIDIVCTLAFVMALKKRLEGVLR